jgi:non-homologous end joining protein Ku
MTFYTRIREEHWLSDKLEEGKIVVLEDESIWEVHPSDRHIIEHWLRISTITVKYTQKEDYPYLLSNSTEGEDARANYLRESAPRMRIAPEVA